MHPNSLLLFRKYVKPLLVPGVSVLEVSPEAIPGAYRRECEHVDCWHTLTLGACEGATYEATEPYHYPVCDGAYGVVLSGQVIEHVPMPWLWMRELARICRPGGLVVTIAPVSWQYHEAPIDCWRIYADGMRALSEYAGLTVEVAETASLDGQVTDTVLVARRPLSGTR